MLGCGITIKGIALVAYSCSCLVETKTMNELHLFAGAGGGILGGILLGHTPICAVEINPYCRKVLLQRQRDRILPRFPIWDDVTTFDGKPWRGYVDAICGGFPCQDISAANRNAVGISGVRSGLWKQYLRIIREAQPSRVFAENSPLLTSRGLGVILQDLAEIGYSCEWDVFSAASQGAEHVRERIFILAYPDGTQREGGSLSIRVDPKHTNTRNLRWGKDKSGVGRVANGVANRVDRLKAIGNGQVPCVAALAWQTLESRIVSLRA